MFPELLRGTCGFLDSESRYEWINASNKENGSTAGFLSKVWRPNRPVCRTAESDWVDDSG